MKFAIEHSLKLILSNFNMKYNSNFVYSLNNKGKYLFVFSNITDQMIRENSILASDEYQVLSKILKFVDFDFEEIKIIPYLKLNPYKEIIDDKDYRKFYKILLAQIYENPPKYILLVGEELTKNIFKNYLKDLKIDDERIKEQIEKFKIKENIGKPFDFYGIKLYVLYDMKSINMLTKNEKKEIVDTLVKIR